jgi:hypothetical protein
LALLIVLLGWLVSRLVLLFYDGHLPLAPLAIVAALQVLWPLLILGVGPIPISLAVALVILLAVQERAFDAWLNEARLATLLVVLLIVYAVRNDLGESGTVVASVIGERIGRNALWFLAGFLLVANEANLAIRSLFHVFRLEPRSGSGEEGEVDRREYNAGRVIGILERWLMYIVLVASQNYGVIAIIIAAKGFARFRELDDRAFAEYVLIGTLASTLLTIMIAEVVMLLMV